MPAECQVLLRSKNSKKLSAWLDSVISPSVPNRFPRSMKKSGAANLLLGSIFFLQKYLQENHSNLLSPIDKFCLFVRGKVAIIKSEYFCAELICEMAR